MNSIHNLSVLFLLIILTGTDCAKILGVFHLTGRSHYLAGNTLMKMLAEKGHEVTIISPFEDKNPPSKNYKQIVLTGLYEEEQKHNTSRFSRTNISPIIGVGIFGFLSTGMVENALKHPEFQNFMKSDQKFDIVIVESFLSEAMKYVAYHFKAHCIVFSALDANKWVNPFIGNPDSPAYLPTLYVPFTSNDMAFFQRAYNSILYVLDELMLHLVTLPMQNKMIHKYFPDAPQLTDIIYNTSLVFLNSDLSIDDAIPKVPVLINIGGFHVTKPKALPNDLQSVLDNAKHGVVYFSLGSNLKSKDMPLEQRQMILNALSKLKELVLWKFEEETLPGKPDNVIIKKWFPQNDILAHKNVKLFITHGGIFSTIEAVYHGVPLLALPVFSEQINNAKRASNYGYARCIPFGELSEETFNTYLQEMLKDSKYKDNIQKRSKIMKDKPVPPADIINYWVEYVIRHEGAPHLRVASLNLAWYQYLLIDVILFIIGLFIILIYVIKTIFRLTCRKNKNSKNIKKKTN